MEPIVNIVSNRLTSYVDAKHKGNISQAAHHIGSDYHLCYRLCRGKQKGLSFTHALDILKKISPDEFEPILRDCFPDKMQTLDGMKTNGLDPMVAVNQKFSAVLKNETSFKIYIWTHECKVKVSDIRDELGNSGNRELERLIGENVVSVAEDGIVFNKLRGYLNPSQENFKALAKYNLENLDIANAGTMLESLFGRLNKEGLRKVFDLASEALKNIKAVLEDERYKGDLIVLSSILLGPFSLTNDDEVSK